MEGILKTVEDCGGFPEQKPSWHGIRTFTTYDKMEHAVKNAAKQMTGGIET
ncbi:hypothetical protein [Caproicibacter sp.]|uniref:hypothetical protein n=1 Tax=Caproicibacter sp. TaxID=2814884 RepID=UPI003989AC40